MSIAELNTLYAAYEAALASQDYDTAIEKLMVMQARLASTPNLRRALGTSSSQEISWNPGDIDKLITRAQQLKGQALATSSGSIFATSKVTYERAGAT